MKEKSVPPRLSSVCSSLLPHAVLTSTNIIIVMCVSFQNSFRCKKIGIFFLYFLPFLCQVNMLHIMFSVLCFLLKVSEQSLCDITEFLLIFYSCTSLHCIWKTIIYNYYPLSIYLGCFQSFPNTSNSPMNGLVCESYFMCASILEQ